MDRMEKTVKKININIVTALLGGIAFVLIYGVKILNPLSMSLMGNQLMVICQGLVWQLQSWQLLLF